MNNESEDKKIEKLISRRRFLKLLGLGTGSLTLSSLGAAELFKITDSSGQSKLDADRVDGYDFLSGTLSSRPSAGQSGRIYHTTDGNGSYYDDGSSWIQVSKGITVAIDEITTDVVLNGQSIEVIVYEDTDGDGTAENTETVNLDDGSNTYSLSNIEGGSGNDYWIQWQISNSDVTQTATANSAQLKNVGTWETASEWDSAQSESGVAHESTSNTDHNDATIVKQGYPYGSFNLISPTPVSCWPLHEDSGSTAYDVAGGENGSLSGPTVGQTGILGTTSYSFNGSSDLIDIGSTNWHIAGQNSITVTAWINWDGGNSSEQNGIYTHSDQSSNNPPVGMFVSSSNNNNEIALNMASASGSSTFIRGNTVSTNTWLFVCGVIDYGNSEMRLYENASQTASTSISNGIWDVSEDVHIGNWKPQYADWYSGKICDVRVYDTALTSSQIQTLYDVVNTQGTLKTAAKTS